MKNKINLQSISPKNIIRTFLNSSYILQDQSTIQMWRDAEYAYNPPGVQGYGDGDWLAT